MRDYLKDNGWTYPIVSRAGAEVDSFDVEVEEVVAMRDMLLAFEDPVACVKAMAHADVKIVSLTITEFGYRVPLTNGDFSLIEQALNGLLVPATLKYADNIMYSYAKPLSIVMTTVFGSLLLGVLPPVKIMGGVPPPHASPGRSCSRRQPAQSSSDAASPPQPAPHADLQRQQTLAAQRIETRSTTAQLHSIETPARQTKGRLRRSSACASPRRHLAPCRRLYCLRAAGRHAITRAVQLADGCFLSTVCLRCV